MDAQRVAFAASVADAAWVRGEDAASLRAVAAWRRAGSDLIALTITDKAASDALATVERVLDLEVRGRLAEIAAAHALNRDVVRQARGDPSVAVPALPEVAVDPDAVARWLVGHAGGYWLQVGRWRTEERLVRLSSLTSRPARSRPRRAGTPYETERSGGRHGRGQRPKRRRTAPMPLSFGLPGWTRSRGGAASG